MRWWRPSLPAVYFLRLHYHPDVAIFLVSVFHWLTVPWRTAVAGQKLAPRLGITAFLSVAVLLSLLILLAKAVRDTFDPNKGGMRFDPASSSIENLSIAFPKRGESLHGSDGFIVADQRGDAGAGGNPVPVKRLSTFGAAPAPPRRSAIRGGYSVPWTIAAER